MKIQKLSCEACSGPLPVANNKLASVTTCDYCATPNYMDNGAHTPTPETLTPFRLPQIPTGTQWQTERIRIDDDFSYVIKLFSDNGRYLQFCALVPLQVDSNIPVRLIVPISSLFNSGADIQVNNFSLRDNLADAITCSQKGHHALRKETSQNDPIGQIMICATSTEVISRRFSQAGITLDPNEKFVTIGSSQLDQLNIVPFNSN
jgi:hypothetical protein